jgi:hypothetical protein
MHLIGVAKQFFQLRVLPNANDIDVAESLY